MVNINLCAKAFNNSKLQSGNERVKHMHIVNQDGLCSCLRKNILFFEEIICVKATFLPLFVNLQKLYK